MTDLIKEDGQEASLTEVRDLLARSVELQERGLLRFDEEKYWRRVARLVASVSALVLVLTVAGWVSWTRQADCDRSNRGRAAAIDATVQSFDTTWDLLVAEPAPETKAELLAAIRADQERIRPRRDCSWPA